jgi:hypothetical protein
MNAEQYLNEALGGNMNISTLKPLAWYEIMEGYARHKLAEAQPQADNTASIQLPRSCNDCILKDIACVSEHGSEQCWHNAVTAYFA